MSELPAYLLLSALVILSQDGLMKRVEGGRALAGPAAAVDDHVLPIITQEGSANQQRQHQHQHPAQMASVSTSVSLFTLKVQVNDIMSRQYLSHAAVEVFVNHTKTNSAFTEENGVVLLKVPYKLGLTLTIVASMDGYILTPLPWKTTKMPIFSSVTLSLFPQNQGNIWLFEDYVLITGKLSDTTSQPSVQFPKNLLMLPGSSNISSVTAYLTLPQMSSEKDCFLYTVGILNSKSGYKTIELNPLAAINVQLFSSGKEVQVTGPIQITLPLPDRTRMRPADTVPAWAFDSKTGAWVNRGLGLVKKEEDRLVWTYVAPQLGYWIAAPLPSARGYIGHATTMDFISYHTYLLIAILGGTLVIVLGFLTVLLCYCRGSAYKPPKKKKRNFTKMEVLKKDQTTSTSSGNRDVSLMESARLDEKSHSRGSRNRHQREDAAGSKHKGNFNIYVEDVGLPSGKQYDNTGNGGSESSRAMQQPIYVNTGETVRPKEMMEQKRVHLALNDNMFFPERLVHIYNQPVAILQAPELFHSPEHLAGCKSATLPRKGQLVYDTLMEPMSKDSYTQTLPKMPLLSHLQQEAGVEQQVLEGPQSSASNPGPWGRYSSLLESVSVPGTLNEAVGMGPFCSELQGISEQTLLELSKGKPSPHPRAWFVSLEGKPIAQVRHSFIDLQKKRKPTDSNDTSLDSGVDMNEHPGKKLEREKTFIKSMPHSKILYTEDLDLSSSESGTTAACTPEDPSLRNILDSGDAQADKDQAETLSTQDESESRSTPPPRRLRKVRDKGKSDSKKSTWQIREERPLMSLN